MHIVIWIEPSIVLTNANTPHPVGWKLIVPQTRSIIRNMQQTVTPESVSKTIISTIRADTQLSIISRNIIQYQAAHMSLTEQKRPYR